MTAINNAQLVDCSSDISDMPVSNEHEMKMNAGRLTKDTNTQTNRTTNKQTKIICSTEKSLPPTSLSGVYAWGCGDLTFCCAALLIFLPVMG